MKDVAWPSRRFRWISSMDGDSRTRLEALQRAMTTYYADSVQYYSDIDFTGDNWSADRLYVWIAEIALRAGRILEVGCGRANILKHYPSLEPTYTGIEFNRTLIGENSKRYCRAKFALVNDPNRLPFDCHQFDLVLSVFVLEHCVFPQWALDEWSRVLAPGGQLVILCPNFLGRGTISSQRVGFSTGTGREKLAAGKTWDALVTALDTRLRMPLRAAFCRRKAKRRPQFFINLAPTCFVDTFRPDVDATYLTFEDEIVVWLEGRIFFSEVQEHLQIAIKDKGLILLRGTKLV
jgi:SAM-dependent methyltransferase